VKSIKIDTKISSQVATTHVEQVFRNDTGMMLEGTYFFPIPETASIAEFAIWDGDRRLVGEVRTREEARRIYDEIVRSKRDPGLLEPTERRLPPPAGTTRRACGRLEAGRRGCWKGISKTSMASPSRRTGAPW
jgi:hypothetical protein